jgi:hypothetical protein
MKTYSLNLDIQTACEALHDALVESTDSGAFHELSTVDLMQLQNHINKLLIERFVPLQKGMLSLLYLEENAFNTVQKTAVSRDD